jgi:hypothetical protein
MRIGVSPRVFGWIALFFLLHATAHSEEIDLSEYNGRFRIGMELELRRAYFKNLVKYFDPLRYERIPLTPKLLKRLPESLRGEIQQGHWSKMEIPEREKVLNALALTSEELARLTVDAANGPEGSNRTAIPLKEGLPSSVVALFKGLSWHQDGGNPWGGAPVIEIKHETPVQDLSAYQKQLFALAQEAGALSGLKSPGPERFGTYHFHLSTVDGRELSDFAKMYNKLLLMRTLDQRGSSRISGPPLKTNYQEEIKEKGMIRLIGESELEVRLHNLDPSHELKEILEWLSMPEVDALTAMSEEIQSRLTPKNVKTLAEKSPGTFLSVLVASSSFIRPEKRKLKLSDELISKALEKAFYFNETGAASAAVEAFFENPVAERLLRDTLRTGSSRGRPDVYRALSPKLLVDEEIRNEVEKRLRVNDHEKRSLSVVGLFGAAQEGSVPWLTERILSLRKDPDDFVRGNALDFIARAAGKDATARSALKQELEKADPKSQIFPRLCSLAERNGAVRKTLVEMTRTVSPEIAERLCLRIKCDWKAISSP